MSQRLTLPPLALLICLLLALACSEAESNNDPNVAGTAGNAGSVNGVAGALASGGSGSGVAGTTLGGNGVGGSNQAGGSATAGSATGGAAMGGSATGGSAMGGSATGGSAMGGSAMGGVPNSTGLVEDDGVDCDVGAVPSASAANSKLPDPFAKSDGTRIATKSEWRCQRRRLRKTLEAYVYGEKPAKPESVTGTITNDSITVNVSQAGKTASFKGTVVLPSAGKAPYPVIIGYESFGTISLDEKLIGAEGVAIIRFDPYALGAEGTGRANKKGAFYTIHPDHSKTGLLIAWAWGVSRFIDVIQADGDKLLKTSGIGVTGCSRFGKGSFVAGAFDQRIALGIPFESGTGGVPILRGIGKLESSQSLSSAYGEQPWFGDVFQPFVANPNNLPTDTHASVALYAPRGLLILDNPSIANLGPKAAFVAASAGAEVYKALGALDNFSYHSDTANGTHCSIRTEYAEPLKQAIRKHLLGTGTTAGSITPKAGATAPLTDWIDWQTPTLN
jgi:hypothetical protein